MIISRRYLLKHLYYATLKAVYHRIYWRYPQFPPLVRRPYLFGLELTNHCNLSCLHCFRSIMNNDHGYMAPGLFQKLVDEVSAYKYAHFEIVGRGEPSLHPQLAEFMSYLKGKSIKTELCTNGYLFEKYTPHEILNWDLDFLDISIDGYDKSTYENLRIKGDYDRLRKNVIGFFQTRKSLKRITPIIKIRNVVLPHVGKDQIEEFKNSWMPYSDLITFNRLNPVDDIEVSFPKYKRCKGGIFFNAYVRWDGRVPLCQHHGRYVDEIYIGDLNAHRMEDIWKNEQLQNLRLAHQKMDFSAFPFCRSCFATHCDLNTLNPKLIIPKI